MKLKIDTTDSEKITIAIDGEEYVTSAKRERAQKLLPFIADTLKSKNADIHDITEIEVATGPGSFTGIRVGVSVANALGYALGIPVNGNEILEKPVEINY